MGAYEYGSTVQPSPSPTPSATPEAQCQTTADCPTGYQCYQPPFYCRGDGIELACAQVMPPMVCRLIGDANLDDRVNIVDYSVMSQEFFQSLEYPQTDFNEDGKVDIQDFSLLNSNFSLL